MTREEFNAIVKSHSSFIIMDGDVEEALAFVADLLFTEAESLKKHEPYASNTIKRLEQACNEVNSLYWVVNEYSSRRV